MRIRFAPLVIHTVGSIRALATLCPVLIDL
jgi:hypothetical protein